MLGLVQLLELAALAVTATLGAVELLAPPGIRPVRGRYDRSADELAGRSRIGVTRSEESPDSAGQGGC